jgi:hypothetical protein
MPVPDSVHELPATFEWEPQPLCDYINEAWPDANEDEKGTLFDLAAGLYWYCSDWHGGQFSDEYSIMSAQLGYNPGMSECSAADAGESAQYVYEMLEQANQQGKVTA